MRQPRKITSHRYYIKHKEEIKAKNKKYVVQNKQLVKESRARHYQQNKKRIRQLRKDDYQKNKQQYKMRSAKTRGMNFNILIPNPYEDTDIEWEWHHIDNENVVAVPTTLHQRYINNQHQAIHRQMVNAWVEVIYGIKI